MECGMSGVDVLDLYRGYQVPEWWTTEPPPWAEPHDWAWYIERARIPGAVHAAAERAASAELAVAPED
jgi:hypothetical protein